MFKEFIQAFKEDRGGIRKKVYFVVGTAAIAIVGSIVLTRVNDNSVDVLVLEEGSSTPELPSYGPTE